MFLEFEIIWSLNAQCLWQTVWPGMKWEMVLFRKAVQTLIEIQTSDMRQNLMVFGCIGLWLFILRFFNALETVLYINSQHGARDEQRNYQHPKWTTFIWRVVRKLLFIAPWHTCLASSILSVESGRRAASQQMLLTGVMILVVFVWFPKKKQVCTVMLDISACQSFCR